MRTRVLAVALGVLVLVACGCTAPPTPRHDTRTIAQTQTSGAVEGQPGLQMPITIHGQTTCLVPFALVSEKGLFERDDPYARSAIQSAAMRLSQQSYDALSGAHAGSGGGEVRWHNVLARDTRTGEEWPLLTQRGIIGRWSVLGQRQREKSDYAVRGLLFVAVLHDTNKDGSLDDRDARVAILTDPAGRNARTITPRDAQVWNFRYDEETDTLFLMLAFDENHDGAFDLNDRVLPYMLPLSAQGIAVRVVSDPLLDKAEQLLK